MSKESPTRAPSPKKDAVSRKETTTRKDPPHSPKKSRNKETSRYDRSTRKATPRKVEKKERKVVDKNKDDTTTATGTTTTGGGKTGQAKSPSSKSEFSVKLKKMRKLVSRTPKQQSVNQFVEKVNKRKEIREKTRMQKTSENLQSEEELKDVFPCQKGITAEEVLQKKKQKEEENVERSSSVRRKKIAKIFGDAKVQKGRAAPSSFDGPKDEHPSKNNDNEGNVMVGGKPFWMTGDKISTREMEEITQDDLPMNADIVMDVKEGKLDLAPMPNKKVVFDPYHPLDVLISRDEDYFTRDVLFGNTVRTMINLTDASLSMSRKKKQHRDENEENVVEPGSSGKVQRKIKVRIVEPPETMIRYTRGELDKMTTEAYFRSGMGVAK